MNLALESALDRTLGRGVWRNRHEKAYACPKCSRIKFEVRMEPDTKGLHPYHCWVCGYGGADVRKFLHGRGYTFDDLIDVSSGIAMFNPRESRRTLDPRLPEGFVPLYRPTKNVDGVLPALEYLVGRGITYAQVVRYRMGVCLEGKFSNRVIVPSYNSDGYVNHFVARAYLRNQYPKYDTMPDARPVIFFENQLNFSYPITLCEGVFDAIRLGFNATPMLGKFPGDILFNRIIDECPQVNVVLDADAVPELASVVIRFFEAGLRVKMIRLQADDPGSLPHDVLRKKIIDTPLFTYSNLAELKIRRQHVRTKRITS